MKEFAQEFNVTATAVHKWILERKIYAEKLEGTRIWRIPIEEIERYKDKSRKTTKRDIFNRRF
ncbi:MAG: helix-turn-helix domain-containing protein [Endomicrobium sp.]|nr:helix-turn-helix domain-containing protein [Endomicrobium sp.]